MAGGLKSYQQGEIILVYIFTLAGAIAIAYLVGRLLEKAFHDTEEMAHHSTASLEADNKSLIEAENKLGAAREELHHVHDKLLDTEKMASLGQLAAGIAHEVNNPLSYVTTNLQIMQGYTEKIKNASQQPVDLPLLYKDMSEVLTESIEGVRRIKNIVNSLVMFSSASADKRQYADINEIIENTTLLVWHEIKYKCELVKDLGPLPQTLCYARKLNHAFFNIIQNAYQAIDQKGKITIITRVEDGIVVIKVSDTGRGIQENSLPKVFEPFTDSALPGHIGIGLSVAQDIINLHKGTINITSKPAQGSTVTIRIPVEQEAQG